MTDHQANWITADELLPAWTHDVLHGSPPLQFVTGLPLDLEPGRVTLLGGAPGAGKTALTMQTMFTALTTTPDLRAIVANVEMLPQALLERRLSAITGVPATRIMRRLMTDDDRERLQPGLAELAAIAPRLRFLQPPLTMTTLAIAADAMPFDAPLVLVADYAQRLAAGPDRRQAIDHAMTEARQLADAGAAVLIVSAVGRQRDSRGNSNYAGLGLGSFRESSELEFGADTAFVLTEDRDAGIHRLACVKSRYGETAEHQLRFIKSHQRFEIVDEVPAAPVAAIASEVFGD